MSLAASRFRSRVRTALAAMTVMAGVGLVAAQPVTAAPRETAALDAVDTYTGLTFTVPAGTDDLGQPQTCTIDADLYKPHSASRDAQAPAILTTNGFGGSKDDQAGLGRAFAQRGYTVLSYTGLGFPDSGCKISLDDPGIDGAARQLARDVPRGRLQRGIRLRRPRRGPGRAGHPHRRLHPARRRGEPRPRVGMVGGSYGGQIQFATAAVDSRVDTLVR